MLEDERLLLGPKDLADFVVMVNDLERCRTAILDCNERGRPVVMPAPTSSPRWPWFVAAAATTFAAGMVAGAEATR